MLRRGYLFAAPVTEAGFRPTEVDRTTAASSPAPALSPEAVCPPARRPMLEGPSIAVLPFANLSGDAAQDYLSDGLTEDVINGLSRFSGLAVIARNSSFSYKGRAADMRNVGEQLGVRYLVEGNMRRFDDRVRIAARLVDAQLGAQRWGETFDRSLGDIFSVQDEITQAIVAIVVAHLSKAEIERVSRKQAGSWTAYDLTLQGDQTQNRAEQYWDASYVYEARRLYDEAMRIEPDNARICAKLGIPMSALMPIRHLPISAIEMILNVASTLRGRLSVSSRTCLSRTHSLAGPTLGCGSRTRRSPNSRRRRRSTRALSITVSHSS